VRRIGGGCNGGVVWAGHGARPVAGKKQPPADEAGGWLRLRLLVWFEESQAEARCWIRNESFSRPPSRRSGRWGVGLGAGWIVGLSTFGSRLFNLLDDVFVGFLTDRLHQVFLGVFVGGGVEGDFLCVCGVSSSDDDVGDSFQFGERLTDVLFTAASRNACHGDRIDGLGGSFSRADPCEEGQCGECHSECFHGIDLGLRLGWPQSSAGKVWGRFEGSAIRESAYRRGGKKAVHPRGMWQIRPQ
jgi:hypothetical protein